MDTGFVLQCSIFYFILHCATLSPPNSLFGNLHHDSFDLQGYYFLLPFSCLLIYFRIQRYISVIQPDPVMLFRLVCVD